MLKSHCSALLILCSLLLINGARASSASIDTERRRDLTGATTDPEDRKIAPRVGGSQAFRAFIRSELVPQVAERYRITGEPAIVGESLAGLFVLETLLTIDHTAALKAFRAAFKPSSSAP